MNKLVTAALAAVGLVAASQAGAAIISQTQNQTVTGQNFTFNFSIAPTSSNGTLVLHARGDYSPGVAVESFSYSIDGGVVSGTGVGYDNSTQIAEYAYDDTEFSRTIALSDTDLATIAADGLFSLFVDLDSNVNYFGIPSGYGQPFIEATLTYDDNEVPEPAMLGLFGLGALGLGLSRRRKA